MRLFDFFRRPPATITDPRAMSSAHGLTQRARLSHDTADSWASSSLITSPDSYEGAWQSQDIAEALENMSPAQLMDAMVEASPEVSDAHYLFLRMCNPGYETAVSWPNSEREHRAGRKALDDFTAVLSQQQPGGINTIIGRLNTGQYLRGAALAELVLKNGRMPIDLVTPDPATIRFKKERDPDRGMIYRLGQWQSGQFIHLDTVPTVAYAPVDPKFGPPYGRIMAAPAVFAATFLLSLLRDVKRVVMQQGYNRLDITVKVQELLQSMPTADRSDPAKVKSWITQAITDIQTMYASLKPDDAYIHTESIEINRPVGTADSDSLKAIDALIRALERMAGRGLKTMPLLLGSNESVTETHAKYQWALQTAVVRSMQHNTENLLNRLLTLALTAQGIPAVVTIKFDILAPDRLMDANTRAAEIANAREEYAAGWISQDEAAEKVAGHKADQEAPRSAAAAQPQEELPDEMDRPTDRTASNGAIGGRRPDLYSMQTQNGSKVLIDL